MYRKAVASSDIASIGYDDFTKTLEVEFNRGDIYQYYDVSEVVHKEFINACSPGKYFHAHIRDEYRHSKVP